MSEIKKHDYLNREDHYESRIVNKGRIYKYCEHCGKEIPKGWPSETHTFYPEFSAYFTHITNPDHGDNLRPGEKSCSDLFIESLN
jgi:hypothetical protein